MNHEYFIVSPDGFPIHIEDTYPTPEKAWEAFEDWKKNFGAQGYYSTCRGNTRMQIPLSVLKDFCSLESREVQMT